MLSKLLSASVLSLALLSGAASAATISNGSFETGAATGSFLPLGTGSTSITGWTVASGSIDYIGSYWTAQDGGRSIDLAGSGRGSISTMITGLVTGKAYELSFWMSGNPEGTPKTKTMDVTLANPVVTESYSYNIKTSGNTRDDMKWEQFALRFTATSSSSLLTFAAANGGANSAFGPALDNVSISAVPVPASGMLLFGALGGIAALRRRRKAA